MFGKGRKQVRLNDAVKHHSIATPILPCSNSLLIRGWFSHGIPHEQKVSYLLCVKKDYISQTDGQNSLIRYYFIFSLKGLDLSGKSLELFTTSQALFFEKDSGFSESTNIVLNHIREMKYSSMIFVVKQ